MCFRNIGVGTFRSPNAALSAAGVDPEGTLGVCVGLGTRFRRERFRLLKENAEGTYKTKHAEAASQDLGREL